MILVYVVNLSEQFEGFLLSYGSKHLDGTYKEVDFKVWFVVTYIDEKKLSEWSKIAKLFTNVYCTL